MSNDYFYVRVSDKYPIADRTVAIELVAEDGGELPPFSAGAYIDVDLGFGLPRQYSLANDPTERRRYLLGVLRADDSRGTSVALNELVMPGHSLRISPPKNLFPLDETVTHTLLVGGGIGVTPMLAFGHRLHRLGRSFALHFCARSRRQAPFVEQLDQLPFRDRIQLHLDDDPNSRFDPATVADRSPADSQLYLCGPQGFMDQIAQQAGTLLPEARIYRESFSASEPVSTPVNQPFEVALRSSGEVLQIPADRALVDVLQDYGLPVRRNCPRGFCGGCAVTVLEGAVEHRDQVLPDHARDALGQMLSCVSRGQGRLLLDL